MLWVIDFFGTGTLLPAHDGGALVLIRIRARIGGAVWEQFLEGKVPALPQHAHSDLLGLWDLLKASGGGEGIRTPGTLRFI